MQALRLCAQGRRRKWSTGYRLCSLEGRHWRLPKNTGAGGMEHRAYRRKWSYWAGRECLPYQAEEMEHRPYRLCSLGGRQECT